MGTVTISGPSPTSTKVPPERVAWRTNTEICYILQNTVTRACAAVSKKIKPHFVAVMDCPGHGREARGEAGCCQEPISVKHTINKA